jgi:hypothetical protein
MGFSRADAFVDSIAQVNKATLGLLKRVEPYVAFGYPNLKSVRELMYKRGFAKVGSRTAICRLPQACGGQQTQCMLCCACLYVDQQQPYPPDGQQAD